jgi:hypothetical protein
MLAKQSTPTGNKCKEHCLKNPWVAAKEKMIKLNYLGVKRAKNKWNDRKGNLGKCILNKVEATKRSILSDVLSELVAEEPSPWKETIRRLEAAQSRK